LHKFLICIHNALYLLQSREVEKEAISEGVKENGMEDSEKVVRSVLGQRHTQELADIEKKFSAQRKIMLDEATQQLAEKYDKLRAELSQKHGAQLQALQVGLYMSYTMSYLYRIFILLLHTL
jgi:hypothetical protein